MMKKRMISFEIEEEIYKKYKEVCSKRYLLMKGPIIEAINNFIKKDVIIFKNKEKS